MKKLPVAELVVGLLVLASGIGVFAWAHRDEGELEETKRRGAEIVSALETYRAAQGTYPDSLPQLLPQYLPAIPEPLWGLRVWRYILVADAPTTLFLLSVAKDPSGYPALHYDPAVRSFVLNN